MRRLLPLLIWLAAVGLADAAVTPKPGAGDPRIQAVLYDPQQVISLRVGLGYALTLEFAPDEKIENVALGNGGVWQVTPNKSADHLFIKPMVGAVDTNLTVITDARSYVFELKPIPAADPAAPFIVRILYQTAAAVPDGPVAAPETTNYAFSGAKLIRPVEMSDDGRSTFIVWPPKAPIPAVFILNDAGREALVNGAVRDGRFVIDQVAGDFIFRLGSQEARAHRRIIKVKRR